MPRGNPNVWKTQVGQSYAVLADAPSNSAATTSTSRPEHRAGAPSNQRPRGAGSFQAQPTWAIAPEGTASSLSTATEAKTQFRPPPSLERTKPYSYGTSFPTPTYPHDRKTLNQIDYSPDTLKGAQRSQPARPRDSGRLLPVDVPPQYGTAYATTFTQIPLSERGGPKAGHPAAQKPAYNIITGGEPLGNNRFEYFDGSRDYRKHR